MPDAARTPAPARPAASILVVRDGPKGLQVLMMERPGSSRFAPGAVVFPGGGVESSDWRPGWKRWSRGALAMSREALAFRVAAVRELFEEAGLLILAPKGRRGMVSNAQLKKLERRYRGGLISGGQGFDRMIRREGLEPLPRRLVLFSHWITPEPVYKRYDTEFFIVEAPRDQEISRRGGEAADLRWISPAETLDAWENDDVALMFPTRLNLLRLAEAETAAQAIAQAGRRSIIPVTPVISLEGGERRLSIPAEAGFGVTEGVHRDLAVEKPR